MCITGCGWQCVTRESSGADNVMNWLQGIVFCKWTNSTWQWLYTIGASMQEPMAPLRAHWQPMPGGDTLTVDIILRRVYASHDRALHRSIGCLPLHYRALEVRQLDFRSFHSRGMLWNEARICVMWTHWLCVFVFFTDANVANHSNCTFFFPGMCHGLCMA